MDASSAKSAIARATAVGVAQAAVLMVLCGALFSLAGQFSKVFADFGVELPAITMFAIALSYALHHFWYVVLLLICLWPLANRGIVSALWSSPKSAASRRRWYVVTWIALVVLLALAVVALFLPLLSLMSAVSR